MKESDASKWNAEGCHIYISVEEAKVCKDGIKDDYRFLVLANKKVETPISVIGGNQKRQHMSLPSFRWYIDSLWRRSKTSHLEGSVDYPKVEVSNPSVDNRFYMKLPILRLKGD
jgi:hypothetical protein